MNSPLTLIATTAFGLEAIARRELAALGYEGRVVSPGRIEFQGDLLAICRANLWLRTSDRVLVQMARFQAEDFDALFETTRATRWHDWLASDAAFPVVGRSLKSQLSSVPACQRSVKKAIVESLQAAHGTQILPESGAEYKIEVALLKDQATLTMDTTGPSLHKRSYRQWSSEAPLKETLAAALVLLSFWRDGRPLIDPFCGSGTIPIEAALIGRNLAPGLHRTFAAEQWSQLPSSLWSEARQEAADLARPQLSERLMGTDIDERALRAARRNAEQAGVTEQVHFQQRSFADLHSQRKFGCVVTNPPYGERLGETKSWQSLYESIPITLRKLPTWSHFILTSYPNFESLIQRPADRRRKLYNGRIECTYYQFHGPRPSDTVADALTETDRSIAAEIQPADSAGRVERTESASAPSSAGGAVPEQVADHATTEHRPSVPADDKPGREAQPEAKPGPSEPAAPGDSDGKAVPGDSDGKAVPGAPDGKTAPAARDDRTAPQPARIHAPAVEAVFGGLTEKAHEQAGLFHNRLQKLARHLRRWPTRRGITCFRLYDRDIPEIPLVVDRYEDHLHISEYDRPHDRDLGQHADWLDLMVSTAGKTLEIPAGKIFLKSRHRQRGVKQHEHLAERQYEIDVQENGLQFTVNLSDYVDTGLFLDHRITRSMVRDAAEGCHFINLFAYTGAFTVNAAAGGAVRTTTVDWSRNYLAWAERNMNLNGFAGSAHRFVRDDAFSYLGQLPDAATYDLAVVDPPTFSNSKRTEQDWEVQRDHAALLNLLLRRMKPGGIIFFSNNFRRFKLDESRIESSQIREISKHTVPEDFRNKRIHRCWKITR